MSWFSKSSNTLPHGWKSMSSEEDWMSILELSQTEPVAIFKHSTRCSISFSAQRLLEAQWGDLDNAPKFFHLDLIAHRQLSNDIARHTGVAHQSPQLLLIFQNQVLYQASHGSINAADMAGALPQ